MAPAYRVRFPLPGGSVVECRVTTMRWTPDWLDLTEEEDLLAYRRLILAVRKAPGYLPLGARFCIAATETGAEVLEMHLPPEEEDDGERVY